MQKFQTSWKRSNLEEEAETNTVSGILLLDKQPGKTSFYPIKRLRRLTGVRKIGHAGTLDPIASGLLILLVGKNYTRISDKFMGLPKEYEATVTLGVSTDTYDTEGKETFSSDKVPSLEELHEALDHFQGEIEQIPPMFSAKKIGGKKLYELARKGQEVERKPCKVHLMCKLIDYSYPEIKILVQCSKGTYIRSIAHDLGTLLKTGAHLNALRRTKIGPYNVEDALSGEKLEQQDLCIKPYLNKVVKDKEHAGFSFH